MILLNECPRDFAARFIFRDVILAMLIGSGADMDPTNWH